MKAFAVLVACLLLSPPALAFGHAGGSHFPGGRPGHGHHHGHGGDGLGLFGGGVDAPEAPAPANEPPVVEPVAEPFPVPVPYCPRPLRPRASGPHIIYIGHQPAVHGPRVIYVNE